jgi:hypothetical protein
MLLKFKFQGTTHQLCLQARHLPFHCFHSCHLPRQLLRELSVAGRQAGRLCVFDGPPCGQLLLQGPDLCVSEGQLVGLSFLLCLQLCDCVFQLLDLCMVTVYVDSVW